MSDIERRFQRNLGRAQTIANKSMRRNSRQTAIPKMRKLRAVASIIFRQFNGITIDEWEYDHIWWVFDSWLYCYAEKTRADYYRAITDAMVYLARHEHIPHYGDIQFEYNRRE